MGTDWTRAADKLPERGQSVDWIDSGGVQVDGGKYDIMWFLPGGMYIYYDPMFWRPSVNSKGDN